MVKMDDTMCASTSPQQDGQFCDLRDLRTLLWGPVILESSESVFGMWSQGFEFSDCEPTAIVQKKGGPCAVIAPVQAFLLKILLLEKPNSTLSDLTYNECKSLLIRALCNILQKCKNQTYRIVTFVKQADDSTLTAEENIDEASESHPENDDDDMGSPSASTTTTEDKRWTPDQFHERLTVLSIEQIEDVEKYYSENSDLLTGPYGVILLLYSVVLTKGVENVMLEVSDTSEPLIHSIYGYGSQALINLMLTGRSVGHVWDNDQDVGGLKLKGIDQQADIGFITLMEQMRYCTVGSFYKNPKNPVWIMGSETHLTVLFSNEKRLVSPETASEIARRVFKSYDPEGNNFIPSVVLQDVLCCLDLVSDPEYVDIMKRKLDPESLGIILLNAFMDEFFAEETRSMPDTFELQHYNGIPSSNNENKVRYNKGTAILLESDLKTMCNLSNPILTCLQTKWPNIEVNWENTKTPSLN